MTGVSLTQNLLSSSQCCLTGYLTTPGELQSTDMLIKEPLSFILGLTSTFLEASLGTSSFMASPLNANFELKKIDSSLY